VLDDAEPNDVAELLTTSKGLIAVHRRDHRGTSFVAAARAGRLVDGSVGRTGGEVTEEPPVRNEAVRS
jgi:hypothetical protein